MRSPLRLHPVAAYAKPGVLAGMYNMSFQGRDHERQGETGAKEYKVGTNLSKEDFDAVRTHAACFSPPSVADALLECAGAASARGARRALQGLGLQD